MWGKPRRLGSAVRRSDAAQRERHSNFCIRSQGRYRSRLGLALAERRAALFAILRFPTTKRSAGSCTRCR